MTLETLQEDLKAACQGGNIDEVRRLLEQGADANDASTGCTPLTMAAMYGQENIVTLLLDHGAEVNPAPDRPGNTPLSHAIRHGSIPMVQILIDRGADVNLPSYGDYTPLHQVICSTADRTEIARLLLAAGANVDAASQYGGTALLTAIHCNNAVYVRLLIEAGADVNVEGRWRNTPLNLARRKENSEIADMLVSAGAGEPADAESDLRQSIMWMNTDAVRRHVESGANVNALSEYGTSPLMDAAYTMPEIVQVLLDHGADVNATSVPIAENMLSMTALMHAVAFGKTEIIRLLLEAGADPTVEYRYPHGISQSLLSFAVHQGSREIVRLLLEHGASASKGDRWDNAPLMTAISNGHVEIVQLLIEHGVDLHAPDEHGWTPLQWAMNVQSGRNRPEIVRLLATHGADVNSPSEEHADNSLLVKAVEHDDIETFLTLIDLGADINATGNPKWPLFAEAAKHGSMKVLQHLIEIGADVTAEWKDEGGGKVSSVILAANEGHRDAVSILLDLGANADQALRAATERGDLPILQMALDHGAEIDSMDETGQSALLRAISGHWESTHEVRDGVVRFLLDAGANPNLSGHALPLHWAVQMEPYYYGCENIIRMLLSAGADINACAAYGDTALMSAVSDGHIEYVRLLLDGGADVNFVQTDGDTAWNYARRHGLTEIAKFLEQAGATEPKDVVTNLFRAILWNRLDAVQSYLAHDADVNARRMNVWPHQIYPISAETEFGNDVEPTANPGDTPLTYAVQNWANPEVVRLLLDSGAEIEASGSCNSTALCLAASAGLADIVRLLIERGAGVNPPEQWPLIDAARSASVETVKLLLEAGADVNAISPNFSETALIVAAQNGNSEIGRLLLEHGADALHRTIAELDYNYARWDALTYAAHNGTSELILPLLERGADINSRDVNGFTPLMLAVEIGNEEVTRILIQQGADINARDERGRTAVYRASRLEHESIVKLLTEAGAEQTSDPVGPSIVQAWSISHVN